MIAAPSPTAAAPAMPALRVPSPTPVCGSVAVAGTPVATLGTLRPTFVPSTLVSVGCADGLAVAEAVGDVAGADVAGADDAAGDDAGGDEAGGVDAGGVEAGGVDAGGDDAGGVEAGGVVLAGGVEFVGGDVGGATLGLSACAAVIEMTCIVGTVHTTAPAPTTPLMAWRRLNPVPWESSRVSCSVMTRPSLRPARIATSGHECHGNVAQATPGPATGGLLPLGVVCNISAPG
jgi:hypothetical protein